MSKKALKNIKLIVTIESDKKTHNIKVVDIFDNRTNKNWSASQINERGIMGYVASDLFYKSGQLYKSSLDELKETLNHNLNGEVCGYYFKWGQSGNKVSTGYAYIAEPTV